MSPLVPTATETMTSACIVCGGVQFTPLPMIGSRSMASDLRVVESPLRKEMCAQCGLVRSAAGAAEIGFAEGYGLYAHAPGAGEAEAWRQRHYADWIASVVPSPPNSVLDVGCGNGSLLLALREHWPGARLQGCDPSRESVSFGLASGLALWASDVAELPRDVQAELIVTVNVAEHVADPLGLFVQLRSRARPGAMLIVVCPDGSRPDVELLIADHRYSFTAPHLNALLMRAGWSPHSDVAAPPQIGSFRMVVAAAAAHAEPPHVPGADERLAYRRREFLERWSTLDEALRLRAGDGERLVCFGAGEAAGLLRAYAPETWRHVYACTADDAESIRCFGDLPIVPLADVPTGEALLVAVRPQDQPAVVARLARRFARPIAWYDLVGVQAS